MKAVPLIQKADVQSINTSIIALKEAQKELETLNIQVNRKISDLNKLLDGLDVDEIGGSGKLVQSIRQTDGKIIAASVDLTSTVSSGNSQPVTSGGVYDILKHYPDVTYYNIAQSENMDCNDITDRVCLVTALMNNWQNLHYPFQGLVFIITANNTNGDGFQKAISWGYDGTFPEYTRVCKNGVWQSWISIIKATDFSLGNLRFSWLKLNPDNVHFTYVIPQNAIHRVDGVENKTVVICIKVYQFVTGLNIQLSYGNSDPYMQQMSGEGRAWFEEIKDDITPDGYDGPFKIYNRRISVPQGFNIFGIGTNVNIGILDLHLE